MEPGFTEPSAPETQMGAIVSGKGIHDFVGANFHK
jgi:hypothetical protein